MPYLCGVNPLCFGAAQAVVSASIKISTMSFFRQELFSVFTCFYALILIIIGLVLELSHLLNDGVESTRVGQARDMVCFLHFFYWLDSLFRICRKFSV